MRIVCEMCGKTSSNDQRCSHCGKEIVEDNVERMSDNSIWGYATFYLNLLPQELYKEVLEQMRSEWELLERYTVLKLTHSQLDKFNLGSYTIKVLMRETDYFFLSRKFIVYKELGSTFEIEGAFTYAAQINEILTNTM